MHFKRLARTGSAAALAVAWLALGVVPAAAQAGPFSLAWDAPAECPDEAYVRGAIEQLLAGGPGETTRVAALAVVTGQGDAWQVKLTTVREGASGERALEASSCRSLADATAPIVALTIDPARVAANRASTQGASPETPAASATPSPTTPLRPPAKAKPNPSATSAAPPPSPPAPSPTTIRNAHFALFPSIGGDLGTLPKPAYGFTLAAAVLLGSLRLEGYGSFWPPERARSNVHNVDGADFQLWAGGARGCYMPLRGVFELGACAGLELGVLHGQGLGVVLPAAQDGFWIAGTAGARASWRIVGPFGLAADVGIAIPFQRDQFQLDQLGTIHQASPVVGRAIFGPELRF